MNGNFTDAISRQAAIDAINTWDKFGVDERGRIVRWHEGLEPYVHLRDVLTAIVNLPPAQPEVYKPISMEEVLVELGASTVHTAMYFSYCLQKLDFLGFSICKKEVNKG